MEELNKDGHEAFMFFNQYLTTVRNSVQDTLPLLLLLWNANKKSYMLY